MIGVHSGKYPAERSTERLATACDRLGVTHPVVNDRQFRIWRSYDVRAWPTTVLIGPGGRYLGSRTGEFDVGEMVNAISGHLPEQEGTPFVVPPPGRRWPVPVPEGPLRYPGRVLADGDRLFVSDTGHARVLELALDPGTLSGRGRVRAKLVRRWGGTPGMADGPPDEACFAEPQGLALSDGSLFVADRTNHAVRRIDLSSGAVDTVAGTGDVGRWSVRSGAALRSPLRSPWGLATRGGTVFVAMAGSHQLWALEVRQGTLRPQAGGGGEDISDGRQDRAALAQPMGIAAGDGDLYFVDSESSSVRIASVQPTGTVRTIVGTGLFDHGDRDGSASDALLQHPQDLALVGDRLLVADTYNDKLKWVDPVTRESRALPGEAGSGEALAGPSGVCAAGGGRAFVADTDAHAVRLVDLEDGSLRDVEVEVE